MALRLRSAPPTRRTWLTQAIALAGLCGAAAARRSHAGPAAALTAAAPATALPWQDGARCIVPARPGGGFDLTCQLIEAAWPTGDTPLRRLHRPGGIGALAYAQAARPEGRQDAGSLVAFSSGTLLNLAQHRFGTHAGDEVCWLAALALDHGAVAVHRDAPWPDLPALLRALQADPARLSLALGGTLGSQDWMKAALLARAGGVNPKRLRVVAFEGGGEALGALAGGHVQVFTGDTAELGQRLAQGAPLRVLATLTAQRLPGRWRHTPTAAEQGVPVEWPIVRGVYMGRDVPLRLQQAWRQRLHQLREGGAFRQALADLGLHPVPADLPALDGWVPAEIRRYRALLASLGWPPSAG